MQVRLIAAMSLNGLITHGPAGDDQPFTSQEDKAQYQTELAETPAVVIGSTTYRGFKAALHPEEAGPLVVVMTRQPAAYADKTKSGRLEFSDAEPKRIVENLTDRGFKRLLVCGGSYVYGAFLAAGVVDELLITIEPKVFADGTSFVQAGPDLAALQLQSVRQLNDRGTLLLRYAAL